LERLVAAVGRRMGLSETELSDLATATRVRDIGMATVPDEIITKDGPLDDREWAVIRMHPERSADMLDPAPAFARVREIVRASHEHLDGSGYPHGLAGDRIPTGARILLAVESYLAMAGERSFGGLLSEQDSLDRIKLGAGRIYDPAVVAALAAGVAPEAPRAERPIGASRDHRGRPRPRLQRRLGHLRLPRWDLHAPAHPRAGAGGVAARGPGAARRGDGARRTARCACVRSRSRRRRVRSGGDRGVLPRARDGDDQHRLAGQCVRGDRA